MNAKTMMAVMAAAAVLTLRATDSDTVAFYPFTDVAADDAAAVVSDPTRRVTVTNAVAADAFTGKIRLFNSATTERWGKATFEDDIPGAFLYSDWYFTNLQATTYQSLHFESNSLSAFGAKTAWSGAALLVESIGAELAKKGDYTIEFFWKCHKLKNDYWSDKLVCVRSRSEFDCRFRPAVIESHEFSCYYYMPADVRDGRWHHFAVEYDSATKKYDMYSEYECKKTSSVVRDEVYSESDDGALVVGATVGAAMDGSDWNAATTNDYGLMADCSFAALRVTSRKLATSEFMVALSEPPANDDGTYFHWSMTGTDGEGVVQLANRFKKPVDVEHEANRQAPFVWNLLPSVLSVHDPQMVKFTNTTNGLASRGAYVTGTSGEEPARYRTDANGRTRWVSAGGQLIDYRDSSSCLLKSYASNSYGLGLGAGVSLDIHYTDCTNHPFTVEGFLKQDYALWDATICQPLKEAGSMSIVSRTTIGGIHGHYRLWYGTYRQNTGVFHLGIDCADTNTATHASFAVHYTYGCPKNQDLGVKPSYAYFSAGSVPLSDLYSRWNHWAVTYDPSTLVMKVYWNGELKATETLKGALDMDSEGGSWRFGSGFNNSSWVGTIDEIRMTKRVLEPAEFLRMRRTPTGAVLYLK